MINLNILFLIGALPYLIITLYKYQEYLLKSHDHFCWIPDRIFNKYTRKLDNSTSIYTCTSEIEMF